MITGTYATGLISPTLDRLFFLNFREAEFHENIKICFARTFFVEVKFIFY
jgi:hypothetical protein